MMIIKPNCPLVAMLMLVTALQFSARGQSPVALSPRRPIAGKDIRITYQPGEGLLKNRPMIYGVVYTFSDFQWQAHDLELKRTGSAWQASYHLENNTVLIALKFEADTVQDTNTGTGYIYPIADEKGKEQPGTQYALAVLRSVTLKELGLPDYPSIKTETDSASESHLAAELKRYPASARYVYAARMELLNKKLPRASRRERIEQETTEYLASLKVPQEEDYKITMHVGQSLLHDIAWSDSLRSVAAKLFPGGVLAQQQEYARLLPRSFRSKAGKDSLIAFGKKIDWSQLRGILGTTRTNFSMPFDDWLDSSYDRLQAVIPYLDLAELVNVYRILIAQAFNQEKKTPEFLVSYSAMMIRLMENSRDRSVKDACLSPREWEMEKDEMIGEDLYVHGVLLYKCGRLADAFPYIRRAFNTMPYQVAFYNHMYLKTLPDTSTLDRLAFIEKCFRNNAITDYMLARLKPLYLAKYGTDANYGAWLQELKPKDHIDDIKKYVRHKMIDVKLSDFILTNTSGQRVSSTDLLGKVIVLDFWATWCGPCKASFAGMKLAVDQFKGNPDVKFFFAATDEHDPDYKEKITSFLKANDYTDFPVLYDEKNPGSGKSVFTSLTEDLHNNDSNFNSSAIPLKLIFDKTGKCRWVEVGYNGVPMDLADEISVIVDELENPRTSE